MTDSTGRPQGGNGAARPSAIRTAAEELVRVELPFPLPATRWERHRWALRGLTLPLLHQTIDRMAAAGLVQVRSDLDQQLWVVAASTTAATPAAHGEQTV